ncbi:MAG: hypothetical protein IPG02_13960, partial [Ignavibacteria bacterium]|nr:hypothetical protein [Ignavibacteria bacterium]
MEKDEVSDLTGDNKNTISGTPTNEITNEETGLQTTNIAESITIKPSIKVQKEIKTEDNADVLDDGE